MGALGEVASPLKVRTAPFFMPQRSYTLTLEDALLAREDRELLTALAVHYIQNQIDASIQASVHTPA